MNTTDTFTLAKLEEIEALVIFALGRFPERNEREFLESILDKTQGMIQQSTSDEEG